ncbi:hypothetical protein [Actinacidiphila sp. ITFR-21]|uniref:hypothetical protein n=1 Tax=Actinacidiphila sp. ITFR-21 TaxID=3075199 RepID=UPI00288A6961|nr:hypothetical protein [Streptomyces sp. ITFR-21]WNI17656.1 hypothetical protein RLT57_20415 [Streptomyces sp. ITFR-21]WNI17796.1 hypothetical protein RLT57_21130 [Streptomyces sp. ITFR-21]
MTEALSVGTDWRLLGCAYVKFFVARDHRNQRLLERHPHDLSASMGRFAFAVTEEVFFPAVFGVEPLCSYQVVDDLRRRNPDFGAAWFRRCRYRRQAQGVAMCPVLRSRHVAMEVSRMLLTSWAYTNHPVDGPVRLRDIVTPMLSDLCAKLCHSSEHPTDP